MAYVNIPRDRDDPNYRYKMPKIQSRIEGRGNGIKTNITNMGDIARALKRPPMYPTKFFGCELGTSAKFETAEEKALVNGSHAEKDLVVILDKFIEMYVLCPGCHLPESDIAVKKSALLSKCNACGHQGDLDITHKAATYMIRNPPDQTVTTMGKKKKSKEERRTDRATRQKEGVAVDSNEEDGGDKKEKKKKDKENKSKRDKLTKKKSNSLSDVEVNGDEEGRSTSNKEGNTSQCDECDDKSVDDKKKKKKGKRDVGDKLIQNEELTYQSPEISEVIQRLTDFIASNDGVTSESFFRELRVVQVSQDFDSKCRIFVTLEVLFGNTITPESLEKKMSFLKQICDSSVYPEDFLDALQYYCHERSPDTLSMYPYIVQKLYAAELLDHEDILPFYKSPKDDAIYVTCKQLVQPFLDWLCENDSESEEEDTARPSNEYSTSGGGGNMQSMDAIKEQPCVKAVTCNGLQSL